MNKNKSNNKSCDYNNFRRARYFHGMLMTERDFREEQIYHNEKRKLINRMIHGWGVVCGMGISKAGGSAVTISPGVALDCHGNEIVICDPYTINLTPDSCLGTETKRDRPMTPEDCQQLEEERPNTFYIGIRYNESLTDPVPVYAPGGDCEEKVCESSRIHEGFCIKVFARRPYQPKDKYISPSLVQSLFECKDEGPIQTGIAQGVTENTIKLSSEASKTDGFYKGMEIEITSGQGVGQKRTINDYVGDTRIATIDGNWGTYPPTEKSGYKITRLLRDCFYEKVISFADVFCVNSFTCPDCCPEEHYIILGRIEMDSTNKIIKEIYIDDRTYLLTYHLFKYVFSSLLNGIDTLFEKEKGGITQPIPDINLIHTNPIAALCWLGQVFKDIQESKEGAGIKAKSEVVTGISAVKQQFIRPAAEAEVVKLRRDFDSLTAKFDVLQKKISKK